MEKHDLHHEFPEFDSKISELKVSNAHFKKLTDEYDEVNHAVHRIETGVETPADEVLTALRKKRLLLKDELYALLTQ
ncbi:MAG: GTP-binding protein [Sphingobacteriia bacterium 28-36-52]|nr:MAG: GTP-binding protein [Sphingobacteriia bacterium 28-36-52]